MVIFLRPHVGNFTATRGSCILTMQRYHILIAVYECFLNYFKKNEKIVMSFVVNCQLSLRNPEI